MRIVALDLGAKKISYCERSNGKVVKRETVSALSSLKRLLGPQQPEAKVAIEACREAWHVYDVLKLWANDVVLVDTTRSKQMGIGQHGRKTDRIDADKLAQALEEGRIPQAHVLSPARRELRRVLAVRRTLIETRASIVTTVRGLAVEQGQRIPSCDTEKFANKVRARKLTPELVQRIEPLVSVIEITDQLLAKVEEELAVLCEDEAIIQLLTTAPGVGTVVAAAFVSVVDDAKRFHKAHELESYIGLVPNETTTGGKRRIGAISKQGNSYLRALLVQSSWTILRSRDTKDPLHIWGAQVAKRGGKRVAVVALARRLAGVLWAMWRDGTVYDAAHLAKQGIRGVRRAVQTLEQQQAALARAAKKRSVKLPASSRRAGPPKTADVAA